MMTNVCMVRLMSESSLLPFVVTTKEINKKGVFSFSYSPYATLSSSAPWNNDLKCVQN